MQPPSVLRKQRSYYYTGPDIPQEELRYYRERTGGHGSGKPLSLFEIALSMIIFVVFVLALIHPNEKTVEAQEKKSRVTQKSTWK